MELASVVIKQQIVRAPDVVVEELQQLLMLEYGADQLSVLPDVGDQHHRGIAGRVSPCVAHRRRSEPLAETDLIVLAQMLVAQKDHQVLVPDVENLRENLVADRPAEIDTDDLRADRR